jgi:hypothetical protein
VQGASPSFLVVLVDLHLRLEPHREICQFVHWREIEAIVGRPSISRRAGGAVIYVIASVLLAFAYGGYLPRYVAPVGAPLSSNHVPRLHHTHGPPLVKPTAQSRSAAGRLAARLRFPSHSGVAHNGFV